MNPKLFLALFSYRNELKYVALAFAIALLIPIIAVILLTHIGLDIISDKLAQVDENTGNVQLLNPATGEVVEEVDLTVAWPAKGLLTVNVKEPKSTPPKRTDTFQDRLNQSGDAIAESVRRALAAARPL